MSTFLIGLTGPDTGARDTVANLLIVQGWEVRELQHAVRTCLLDLDPLVGAERSLQHLVQATGWPDALDHRIYGPEVARLLTEMDQVMQGMAGPNIWLDHLERELSESGGMPSAGNGRHVVIPDLLTPEQARWVNNAGGEVWRIGARDEAEFTGPGHDDLIHVHLSAATHPRVLAARVEARLAQLGAA